MTEYWFDTKAGVLLDDEEAIAMHLADSEPGDLVPIASLLNEEEFPFQPGSFEQPVSKELSKEELIQLGQRALVLVQLQDEILQPLTYTHINRLHILGLLAHRSTLRRRFGSINAFRDAIGSPASFKASRPNEWDADRTLDYVRQITNGKPLTTDIIDQKYDSGEGPSYTSIRRRLGGVNYINGLLGFDNYRNWGDEEFITYGANLAEANPDLPFSPDLYNCAAKNEFRPTTEVPANRFGHNFI